MDRMRTRVTRVLILVSVLSTLTQWPIGPEAASVGLSSNVGLLAAFAATAGLVLQLIRVKAAWMGPAFAAVVMWRVVFVATVGDNRSVTVGALCATAAAGLMIGGLFADLRARTGDGPSDVV